MLKYICLLILILVSGISNQQGTTDPSAEEHWDILMLDGGGIRGVLTAAFVKEMESFAYQYSVTQYGYPQNDSSPYISMSKLFNMVGGTSTGSLLASAIAYPNKEGISNLYLAQDCINIYKDHGPEVFQKDSKYDFVYGISMVFFICFGVYVGFLLGPQIYPKDKNLEKALEEIQDVIQLKYNNQPIPSDALPNSKYVFDKISKGNNKKLPLLVSHEQLLSANSTSLPEIEDYFMEFQKDQDLEISKKWLVIIASPLIFAALGYLLIPLIYGLFNSFFTRYGIEKVTDEYFNKTMLSEAITEELMIVSYAFNIRQPRIYSKYPTTRNSAIYNVTIADAAQASAAAPAYFDAKDLEGEALIDGGVMANDPGLLAYLRSKIVYKKDKIRLISIGTGEEKTKKIVPDNMDLLSYIDQLGNLMMTATSKAHEFFVERIMTEGSYNRFQYILNRTVDMSNVKEVDNLIKMGQEMWSKEKDRLIVALTPIIDEKIGKLMKKQ